MSTDPLDLSDVQRRNYVGVFGTHGVAGGVDFGDGYSSPPSPTSMFLWSFEFLQEQRVYQ